MPARLLLLCLPLRSSWLTVEAGRQVGAADCCIDGADGQPSLCGSGWLVAFQTSSVGHPHRLERECCD
jgi:hypothetical protein